MKIGNIGRLDPELKTQGIKGLTHGAKMEQEIWDEFYANPERLVFESERLIAKFSKRNIEEITDIDITKFARRKGARDNHKTESEPILFSFCCNEFL